MSDSDRALAERAAGGDHVAFAVLVERHIRSVTTLALAATGNRELARDIAQEAFIEAFKRLGGLRQPGSFVAWVSGIARRKAIYAVRSAVKNPETPAGLDIGKARLDDALSPDEAADASERRGIVLETVSGLPGDVKEVLMMRYVADLSNGEIAAALEVSVEAVEKRLERARELLAEALAGRLD